MATSPYLSCPQQPLPILPTLPTSHLSKTSLVISRKGFIRATAALFTSRSTGPTPPSARSVASNHLGPHTQALYQDTVGEMVGEIVWCPGYGPGRLLRHAWRCGVLAQVNSRAVYLTSLERLIKSALVRLTPPLWLLRHAGPSQCPARSLQGGNAVEKRPCRPSQGWGRVACGSEDYDLCGPGTSSKMMLARALVKSLADEGQAKGV